MSDGIRVTALASDARYTLDRSDGQWIGRFNGQEVCRSPYYSSALMRLVGIKATANGAPTVTEKRHD